MLMAIFSFESPLQSQRWRLVALLSLSVFINYVDRGNLSVAAPVLGRELTLSPAELGLLFSAFFWTYSFCQIPAGWLVDRFNVNRLYAAAYTLWSVVTLLTGFTHTISALLIVRLFLGLGESVAYPACSQILVLNFSEHERGRANSLIDVGAKAGPALGTLLGGLVVAYWGWRVLFIAAGAIGLLWLVPWYLWAGTGARAVRPARASFTSSAAATPSAPRLACSAMVTPGIFSFPGCLTILSWSGISACVPWHYSGRSLSAEAHFPLLSPAGLQTV
jgi:MFS family permease